MSTEPGTPEEPRQQQLSIADAVNFANNLHRSGHLKDARTLYSRVLELEPDHPDALHFMGIVEHQQGKNDAALRLMQRSIELVPDDAGFRTNLGNLLFDSSRFEDAEQEYREAIALSPDRPDVLNNYAVLCKGLNRYDEAEPLLLKAIELAPDFIDARNNLSRLYMRMGRIQESIAQALEAMTRNPNNTATREMLGYAYYKSGQLEQAAVIYREWLEEEPDNPRARHHLAACTGQNVPIRADDDYVQSVFDNFSHSFDAKLAVLEYRAPKLIVSKAAVHLGSNDSKLDILDAGCGTGLCGPLLKPYAKRLSGVDLSRGMLAKAKERQVYDQLHHAELTQFISQHPSEFDLIISADTLVYFGQIADVVQAASLSLRSSGYLGFTVESLGEDESGDYRLRPHGRYAHSRPYLERTLGDAGFVLLSMDQETLRLEMGEPVIGWVILAQRSNERH